VSQVYRPARFPVGIESAKMLSTMGALACDDACVCDLVIASRHRKRRRMHKKAAL